MPSLQIRTLLIVVAIALVSITGWAWATPIYVNGSCGNDANTGASPECNAPNNTGPKLTIQAAINAASVLTEDVVIVADGTYVAPSASIILNKAITLKSAGGEPENCTIAGSGVFPSRVLTVESTFIAANLEGFTITNGQGFINGCGIHVSSPLTITNCTFANQESYGAGGAIYAELGGSDDLEVRDSRFEANFAALGGGAVYAIGGNVSLERCVVTGNHGGLGGGGIAAVSCHLDVIGCTIEENVSGYSCDPDPDPRGAGVLIVNGTTSKTATLINSVIRENRFLVQSASCRGFGAGLATDVASGTYDLLTVKLINCLFVNNGDPDASTSTTEAGGAIHNRAALMLIDNCTFVANGANHGGNGGGAAYWEEYAEAVEGEAEIDNSIFWNNFAPTISTEAPQQIYLDSNHTVRIRHCDVEGGSSAIGGPTSAQITNLIDADPLFDSTDPNHPYRIRFSSPCNARGDNTLLPADEFDLDNDSNLTEHIPFDLGTSPDNDRELGCKVDIGAYEVQVVPGCDGTDIAGGSPDGPDQEIDVNDLLAVVGNWGTPGGFADINCNGSVEINDLLAVIGHWGQDCITLEGGGPAPESVQDCYDTCNQQFPGGGQDFSDCYSACLESLCLRQVIPCD